MAWYGVWPGAGILLAVPIAAVIGLAGLAFGTGLAALNVRYRDFRYVIPFLVQFWMFATPTVYMQPPENSSGVIAVLMWANPMTGLVGGFRAACLGAADPVGTTGRLDCCRRASLPPYRSRTSARSRTTSRTSSDRRATWDGYLRSQWIAFASA